MSASHVATQEYLTEMAKVSGTSSSVIPKTSPKQFKKPKLIKSLPKSVAKPPIKKPTATKPKKAVAKTKPSSSTVNGDSKAQICAGLLEFSMLGIHEVSRLHAASFANYKHVKSTGFAAAMKGLKDSGMIDYPSAKTVRLTDKGKKETPPVQPPKDNAEALARLQHVVKMTCDKTGPKFELICELLSDGQFHTIDSVLKASGYKHVKSTGFANCVSSLITLGFVERGPGTIRLADIAFPYRRPGASSGSGM